MRSQRSQGQSMRRPLAGDQLVGSGVSWRSSVLQAWRLQYGARRPSVGRSSNIAGSRRDGKSRDRQAAPSDGDSLQCVWEPWGEHLSVEHQELVVVSRKA